VSPLPGVHSENALASNPSSPSHYHQSLHQVGGGLHGLQPNFSWGESTHYRGINYFTKWAEAMPTVKSNGNTVTFFVFNQIIAWFNIPSEIVTDHGCHFQNEMMEEIASKLGFRTWSLFPLLPLGKWTSRGYQKVSQYHFAKTVR
jgi:hypothetical protein